MIRLADGLELPLSAVTQTFAILAKKGSGKSYTASVMAEEMLAAGQPVVALDPTGAWFGLRSSADGKRDGFPVVVFGGDHADLPLNPLAGEVVARAVVAKRFPAVIDLSGIRKGESQKFVTAFLEELYRVNREPLHLFIDEADDLCPQRPFGDEARMVGAVEDVVKRGRKKGIGCTLITQRPADLNKQVLTQCEVLIALNISHPKDIAPIEEWVRVHADDKDARKMIGDLPTLPKGEGWIWSPSWLNVFKRVKIRRRHTFDSGATPEVGQTRAEPKKLATVDVEALGEQMKGLAEEAKANNPQELRRQIAELQRQIREKPAAIVDRFADGKAIGAADAVKAVMVLLRSHDRSMSADFSNLIAICEKVPLGMMMANDKIRPKLPPIAPNPKPRPTSAAIAPSGDLTAPQQAILDVVAMLDNRGLTPSRDRVARWLSIHPNGGSYGTNLGRLRADGYLDGFVLTERGANVARILALSPEAAIASLPDEPKRNIIRKLMELARPISRDELAAALGLHPNGGSYGTNLGWLRTLGIITERGPIALTEGFYR